MGTALLILRTGRTTRIRADTAVTSPSLLDSWAVLSCLAPPVGEVVPGGEGAGVVWAEHSYPVGQRRIVGQLVDSGHGTDQVGVGGVATSPDDGGVHLLARARGGD